jgi:uncharacterized protein
MRITARVKPNAKKETVEKVSDTEYIVRVKAPPHEGRANDAVVAALSEYFDIPKSRIAIFRGHTGKVKIVDIA